MADDTPPSSEATPPHFQRSAGGRPTWQPPALEEMQAMLPQYQFECMLGRGGMGAVYKAVQVSLDRAVAIKVLPGDLLGDTQENFTERFINEARLMAKMNHPAIVGVYDFGQTHTGLLYIVMEFIDGTDVRQMIEASGRLPEEYALAITAHVCDALQYAHTHGVVHRDIKPANILINVEGQVKVADFGLAKANDADAGGLTRTNMAMGTPDFVAPEALLGGANIDGRADIYAVGVMLYQMLTGSIPRGAWTLPSVMVQTDPRFDAIIMRAMQMDRENRQQSALDLRRELDVILTVPYVRHDDEHISSAIPKQELIDRYQQQQALVVHRGAQKPPIVHEGQPSRRPQQRQVITYVPEKRSPLPALVAAVVLGGGLFYGVQKWNDKDKTPPASVPAAMQQPSAASPAANALTSLPTTGWRPVDLSFSDRNTSLADGWKNLHDSYKSAEQARDFAVRMKLRVVGDYDFPLRFRESPVTGYLRYAVAVNRAGGNIDLVRRVQGTGINQTVILRSEKLPRALTDKDEFELAAIVQGERFAVFFDGRPILQTNDIFCPGGGFSVGGDKLEVKDLQWMPLDPAPGSMRVVELPRGSTPAGWTDALALVKPESHAERSTWERTNDGLKWVTNERLPIYAGTFQLPVPVGSRYAVAMEFTPTDTNGSVAIILPLGDGNTTACWLSKEGFAGIAKVDGQDPAQLSAPYSSSFKLASGRRYRAQAEVQQVSDGVDIQFHVDDKLVASYHGPTSRLACSTLWQQPQDRSFVMLGANMPATFHRAAVWSLPDVVPPASSSPVVATTTIPPQTFGGHLYEFVPDKTLTWTQAKAAAEAKGGHLATITSKEENDFLASNMIAKIEKGLGAWIGGTDEGAPGQWRWVTGEPFTFTAWNPGEPGNGSGEPVLFFSMNDDGKVGWGDIRTSGIGFVDRRGGYLVEWDQNEITLPTPAAPINLLAMVDVKRDAVKGTWGLKPDGLTTPRSTSSQVLEFNHVAPEEYDFEIEFTVTDGTREVIQVLPLPGRSIIWKMCPVQNDPASYGFGPFLDGVNVTASSREARTQLPRLKIGQRYRSLVEVRKGSLRAVLDGLEVVKWSGDFARLSLGGETTVWSLKNPQHPGVAAYMSDVTFHKAGLIPRGFVSARLAQIEAQFNEAWERDVTQSAAGKAIATLDAQYLNALKTTLARAKKPEDLAALTEEQSRVESKAPLPAADPVNIAPVLGKLRATYRKSIAPLLKQRDAAADPVYARYDQALAALITEVAKEGRLYDVAPIQAKRDEIDLLRHPERAALVAKSTSVAPSTTAPPATTSAASSSTLADAMLKETPPKPFTPEEAIHWALSLGGSATVMKGREESKVLSVAMMPKGKYTLVGLQLGEQKLVNVVSLAGLASLTELRELILNRNLVTDAGLAFLPPLPSLSTLGLHECSLTDDCFTHLAKQPALTNLDVGYNKISGTGLNRFPGAAALTSLSIGSSSLTDEGLQAFTQCKALTSLDLSSSGTSKCTSLAPLAELPSLRSLRLLHDTTDALVQSLAKATQITSLDLTYAPISDFALDNIGSMTSLEELSFYGCKNLTDSGYLKLLSLYKTLKRLNPVRTKLSDAALAPLAEKCTEITDIDVSQTAVSPAGLSALVNLRKLESLRVDANQCSDEGLKHLSRVTYSIKLKSFGINNLETLDKRRMDAVRKALTRYAF
ncbi:MAG: protein kinase [Verrucomicrobiaceae bacterium]